jgi:hypothetical protein
MIHVSPEGDQVLVSVTSKRRPRLYFDQFALYELAKPDHSERFFDRFETHGELFFSHINMMEVGFLRDASAARVREFVRRIGPNWVPLAFEFDKVVIAENEAKPADPHPCLSEALLKFVMESGPLDAPITLDRIIDEFVGDELNTHRKIMDQAKAAMAQAIAGWQKLRPDEVERQIPILSHAGPTLYLLTRMIRAIVSEARAYCWTANDAFDFSHALVPLVYADAVFLDKQWKARMARLNLEGPFATVFYGYEIPQFLDWFERYTVPEEP